MIKITNKTAELSRHALMYILFSVPMSEDEREGREEALRDLLAGDTPGFLDRLISFVIPRESDG